jgi:hypothetical protein
MEYLLKFEWEDRGGKINGNTAFLLEDASRTNGKMTWKTLWVF